MALSLSREMMARVKVDANPVNISTQSKASLEASFAPEFTTIMYTGMANNPTKKSAMAKLISKKCGRFRSLLVERITIEIAFPAITMNAITPKHILQNTFHLLKSISSIVKQFSLTQTFKHDFCNSVKKKEENITLLYNCKI